jgi:ABC-type sugar transport system ATPase subunit
VLLCFTNREELLALADRVGVMVGGRIAGEPDSTELGTTDLDRADAVAVEERGDPSRSLPR